MLISARHQFVFVHVYKVAGESIKAALKLYATPSLMDRALANVGVTTSAMRVYRLGWQFRKHAMAREAQHTLPPELYNSYYKFAFVRNPWDWQVSLYYYMLRDTFHKQHERAKSFANFEAYLEWRVAEDVRFQKEFVTDEAGDLIVDFVGRYERLSDDFAAICQHLDIRAELPHKNRSMERRSYQSYYTDRTRRLVEETFAPDIEFFGYTWENSP